MNVDYRQIGKFDVIYLSGRVDVQKAGEIEKEIYTLIKDHFSGDLIINLRHVELFSSSGLRILLSVQRILKEMGRHLKLCELPPPVKKIFEVVELAHMFDIYDSEEKALLLSM